MLTFCNLYKWRLLNKNTTNKKELLTNYPTNLNQPFIQIAVIRSSGF